MNKVKSFIKSNIKYVFTFILGMVFTAGSVFAAEILFASNQVGYDNTSSGLASTDVQNALDELNTKANSDSFWVKKYKTFVAAPQYYAFGTYKGWCSYTDTNCNSYADFPTTSTTPPSGKKVYLAKYADQQYGVCIKRNGTEHCFRGRNWIAESKHVQEVFSDISCDDVFSTTLVSCHASDFNCAVNTNGYVRCTVTGTTESCYVGNYGDVVCS